MIQVEEEGGGKGKRKNLGPEPTECITNIPLPFSRPPEPILTLSNVGQTCFFFFCPDFGGYAAL